MFKNVSEKLKFVAKIVTWFGIILAVVFFFIVSLTIANNIYDYEHEAAITISVLLISASIALFHWIASLFLYGFAEIVENSELQAKIASSQKQNPVS